VKWVTGTEGCGCKDSCEELARKRIIDKDKPTRKYQNFMPAEMSLSKHSPVSSRETV